MIIDYKRLSEVLIMCQCNGTGIAREELGWGATISPCLCNQYMNDGQALEQRNAEIEKRLQEAERAFGLRG